MQMTLKLGLHKEVTTAIDVCFSSIFLDRFFLCEIVTLKVNSQGIRVIANSFVFQLLYTLGM